MINVGIEGEKEAVNELATRVTDALNDNVHTCRFKGAFAAGSPRQRIWHVYLRISLPLPSEVQNRIIWAKCRAKAVQMRGRY